MKNSTKQKLFSIAEKLQTKNDPSHDFQHVLRVAHTAQIIGLKEKADMDILLTAALFHDLIVYAKNSPQSQYETDESAIKTIEILKKIKEFPQDKIEKVAICIKQCSFSKGIVPDLLEAKILQDADRLEATGAISIMRTFSSGGQMNKPFYNPNHPFPTKKQVGNKNCVDLFYKRLLIVGQKMHTQYAKKIAKRRTDFLYSFLKELRTELKETKIIK